MRERRLPAQSCIAGTHVTIGDVKRIEEWPREEMGELMKRRSLKVKSGAYGLLPLGVPEGV